MPQLPVFAYGTLLPNQPNYHLWEDAIVSAKRAAFEGGRLYDMGYYPMLVEENDGSVKGILCAVEPASYEAVISRLDALEGYSPDEPNAEGYRRVSRVVTLETGETAEAWVYVGPSKFVADAKPIIDGDWMKHVSRNMVVIRNWWRNIHTVAGMHGSST